MRAFITGIAGFAGSHLAEYLLAETDLKVSGLIHSRTDNIAHLSGQLDLYRADLLNSQALSGCLREIKPDYVFHLAGQTSVAFSCASPWETFEVNVRSQLNLLEGVTELAPQARVLVIGSAEEYGVVKPDELPVDEETPLRPDSPYGVSKVAQDMMGLQYYVRYGVPVVRVRSFNHLGARQSERFVAAAFARQVAEIEAGLRPPVLDVGNLEAQRDFTDVRDTVRAYYLALSRGEPGQVYNVGSGVPHRVGELLEVLLSFIDMQVEIRVDPQRLRPSDVPVSYCDYSRLHAATGWQPAIPFEEGLRYTLDYWRARVREGTRNRQ